MKILSILILSILLYADTSLQKELNDYNEHFIHVTPSEAVDAVENDLISRQKLHMEERIPKVGDKAFDFILPDLNGQTFHLLNALNNQPVVLFWYRGGWCPYCNMQLSYYQKYQQKISEAGGLLIGISPEILSMGKVTQDDNGVTFQLLSDINNTIARRYNIVYKVEQKLFTLMDSNFDMKDYYGSAAKDGELPLTIVLVIDKKGLIRYSFVDDDFRKRAEPTDLITVLRQINNEK